MNGKKHKPSANPIPLLKVLATPIDIIRCKANPTIDPTIGINVAIGSATAVHSGFAAILGKT